MKIIITFFFSCFVTLSIAQELTKQDTLIGSNHTHRLWWDVLHYDVFVKPDYTTKTIIGFNRITYRVIKDSLPFIMQIDLQNPLQMDSILLDGKLHTNYIAEKNYYLIQLSPQLKLSEHSIQLFYHGKPKTAANPPWDGGWVWKKDKFNNPWMSVACQGIGASVWYPCKDLQSDEPNRGASLTIQVPDTLVAIGNGTLVSASQLSGNIKQYKWNVTNSINSYNIIPYIGKYTLLHDSIVGVKGKLITDYWVLNYNKQKAIQHLKPNVTKTIKCLEYWFGPYPFYNDTYKIVEAPYLGMEHQSNIAYGNNYINGYAGEDLSKSGWGLKWDFIVVHETAHEWFGNSVTATDVADNWIHEGFASYAEVLFTECEFGKDAGNDYCVGVRKSIKNDVPVVGTYDVRKEGSGDMYNKGSQIIHMIRQLMNDDEKFRLLLNDISQTYYHQYVSSSELENFIQYKTGLNLKGFFNQYLRTTQIPELQYRIKRNKISYRYVNIVDDFLLPISVTINNNLIYINPTASWQTLKYNQTIKQFEANKNYYVNTKKVFK